LTFVARTPCRLECRFLSCTRCPPCLRPATLVLTRWIVCPCFVPSPPLAALFQLGPSVVLTLPCGVNALCGRGVHDPFIIFLSQPLPSIPAILFARRFVENCCASSCRSAITKWWSGDSTPERWHCTSSMSVADQGLSLSPSMFTDLLITMSSTTRSVVTLFIPQSLFFCLPVIQPSEIANAPPSLECSPVDPPPSSPYMRHLSPSVS